MLAHQHHRQQSQRSAGKSAGFTLIELVIATVILGILSLVGASMISSSFSTSSMADASAVNAGQARYVLERLERELREIKYTPVTGFTFSGTPNANKIVFTKYDQLSNSDVVVTICYGSDANCSGGNTITLGSGNDTSTLTDKVESNGFSMSYCLVDGTTCVATLGTAANGTTISATNVRIIRLQLTTTDVVNGGEPISQRTRVALRNEG